MRRGFAGEREPARGRLAARAHLVALERVAAAQMLVKLPVQRRVVLPDHAQRRAVEREGQGVSRVVVADAREGLLAVLLGDEREEVRAVEVGHRAAGKGAWGRAQHVEAGKGVLEHGRAHEHVHEARAPASRGRPRRLLVGREALDEPLRLHLVPRQRLAEDRVVDARKAVDRVEMHHVRVLVHDQIEQPVVVVAENREGFGRGGVQHDAVVGQRLRRAVRGVGVVDQHDVRRAVGRVREPRHERGVRLLGAAGEALRQLAERPVVVDREVRRPHGSPHQARVVGAGHAREEQGEGDGRDVAARHARSRG